MAESKWFGNRFGTIFILNRITDVSNNVYDQIPTYCLDSLSNLYGPRNFIIIVNPILRNGITNFELPLHSNTVSPSKYELYHRLPVMSSAIVLQLHVCTAIGRALRHFYLNRPKFKSNAVKTQHYRLVLLCWISRCKTWTTSGDRYNLDPSNMWSSRSTTYRFSCFWIPGWCALTTRETAGAVLGFEIPLHHSEVTYITRC